MDLPSSRTARCLCAAVALLIAPARASAESAADQAKAEALFAEGRRLLAASRFAEACPKLAESQRLDPAIGTLLNLGDCYEKTGRTASAWSTFRDAEAASRSSSDARRAAVASERAAALSLHLARLTIVVPKASRAPGLLVKRDGVILEREAWGEAAPIDPGWHAIEASAPGKRRWTTPVTIDAAHAMTALTVPPLEDIAAPVVVIEPSNEGRSQRLAGGLVAGAGAAAIGAGVIFTALAAAKNNASSAHCHNNACDARGVDLRDGALGDARAATIGVVAGLAAVTTGAVIWWTAPPRSKRAAATTIGAAPLLGPALFGLTLRGAL